MRRPLGIVRAWRGLLGAVAFLTVVPVPPGEFGEEEFDLSPAVAWFPVIGAAVGAAAGGVRFGLDPLVGRVPSTVLAVTTTVILTGALHQDGLADMCDGLGVRGDRERRLSVMRDSTLGTFGVLALIVWALLLIASLDQLTAARALSVLVVAEAMARLAGILHGRSTPPARRDGLGARLRVGSSALVAAIVLAGGIAVLATGPARAALSLGIAGIVAAATSLLARRAIGGSTGDTLGATVTVAEAVICLALAGTWL